MTFHPQMSANIHGIRKISEPQSILIDGLIVDSWHMESEQNAGGRYVSSSPRFVFFYGKQQMDLHNKKFDLKSTASGFFVPAGFELKGELKQSGEIKHVDIHLDASMLRRFIQKENSLSYLVTINSSKHLKPLLDYLVDECKDRSRTDSHVLTIINTLILEFFLVGHRIDEKTHKEWMENLRQFVLENLEKKISITDLADVVGMSRREFNYNFKAANKQTPYGWIIQQRMIHAKKLLINDTPFAEVSGLTGFTDQSHFNRVFKKMNGCTPTDWKIRASTEILRRKVQDCS